MSLRPRVRHGVAVAVVAASFSACGGARTIDAGVAAVLVSERARGGMDALLEGTLAVVDGCLGITDIQGHSTVVVWPHGTDVVSEAPSTIDVPGIGDVSIGDQVSVGGGVDRSDDRGVGGLTVPTHCDEGEIWLAR